MTRREQYKARITREYKARKAQEEANLDKLWALTSGSKLDAAYERMASNRDPKQKDTLYRAYRHAYEVWENAITKDFS